MKVAHRFNPLCLDLLRFAGSGEALKGHWPLAALERLNASGNGDGDSADPNVAALRDERQVAWTVQAQPGPWLWLQAHCTLRLQCQRCLAALDQTLAIDRRIRFVASEEEAQRLDGEIEEDVLALAGRLNVQELIEDELILALPLVPTHELCPESVEKAELRKLAPASEQNAKRQFEDEPAAPHPFAALAGLKGSLPKT